MVRTQIYLTADQKRQLGRLASASGKKQSEMIREAIDRYLCGQEPREWKAALEAVRGMWAGRGDVDDLVRKQRAEWEQRRERIHT